MSDAPLPSSQPQRSEVVDAWRAIAALAVVMFHGREVAWIGIRKYAEQQPLSFTLESILSYGSLPLAFGGMGVAVFFVLSGYCIHIGHARRLAASTGYRVDGRIYLARRALRIYPPLLFALALTAGLDAITRAVTPENAKLGENGWQVFLVNVATLQNLVSPNYGSNYALWSLSVEIHLYLAYLLLFRIRGRFGLPTLVAVVVAVNLASLWLTTGGDGVFFTNYLAVWWAGAVVAEVDWARRRGQGAWVLGGTALFLSGCGAHWYRCPELAFALCGLGFAMVLGPSLSGERIDGSVRRFLARVGTFSYSLYLVHLPVLVCFCAVLYSGVKQDTIWPAAVGVAVAIAAGYGAFVMAEQPALTALRTMRLNEKTG